METIQAQIESVEMERPEDLFSLKPESLEQSFMALMFVPGLLGADLQATVQPMMDESFTLLPSTYGMHLKDADTGSPFYPETSTLVFEAPESNKQGALEY